MAKNYMVFVAGILGLKIGEHFQVYDPEHNCIQDWCEYVLTDDGVEQCWHDRLKLPRDGAVVVDLNLLICGGYEVVKLPEFPKPGDTYYYPNLDLNNVGDCRWGGTTFDRALKRLGMVYRHKNDAEYYFARDYEKLTGKKWEKRNG